MKFTISRIIELIFAIVYGLSGLGTTAYWLLNFTCQSSCPRKQSQGHVGEVDGNFIDPEFVPFGLSLPRFLHLFKMDMLLGLICLLGSYALVVSAGDFVLKRLIFLNGFCFFAMGVVAVYIDYLNNWIYLIQPLFLDVWFLIMGSLTMYYGLFGIQKIRKYYQYDDVLTLLPMCNRRR